MCKLFTLTNRLSVLGRLARKGLCKRGHLSLIYNLISSVLKRKPRNSESSWASLSTLLSYLLSNVLYGSYNGARNGGTMVYILRRVFLVSCFIFFGPLMSLVTLRICLFGLLKGGVRKISSIILSLTLYTYGDPVLLEIVFGELERGCKLRRLARDTINGGRYKRAMLFDGLRKRYDRIYRLLGKNKYRGS